LLAIGSILFEKRKRKLMVREKLKSMTLSAWVRKRYSELTYLGGKSKTLRSRSYSAVIESISLSRERVS
jgi:hypothetical protein